MATFVADPDANLDGNLDDILPSVVDDRFRRATEARGSLGWRKLARLASFLVVPSAAGALCARATTRRRRTLGLGLTALALGALRVELTRWFRPEPTFDSVARVGPLELRRYHARIEACAQVDGPTLDRAIDHGYGRLACYICGANQTGELIERAMPILTTKHDGCYTVSFMMPPGRTLGELPRPDHPGVELRRVPPREIAVLRFRGPITDDNIIAHEHALLQQLGFAKLSPHGSVTIAAFDSPATLPILRRNELWIEVS